MFIRLAGNGYQVALELGLAYPEEFQIEALENTFT